MTDGGIHSHKTVDRDNMVTSLDGEHIHVFELPDGTIVKTLPGGRHSHVLHHDKTNSTTGGGTHSHKVILPGSDEYVVTEPGDGWHDHELDSNAVMDGGIHSHALWTANGGIIFSKTPGELAKGKKKGKKYKKGSERKRSCDVAQLASAGEAANAALELLKTMKSDHAPEAPVAKSDDWSWADADDLSVSELPVTNPYRKNTK